MYSRNFADDFSDCKLSGNSWAEQNLPKESLVSSPDSMAEYKFSQSVESEIALNPRNTLEFLAPTSPFAEFPSHTLDAVILLALTKPQIHEHVSF